MKRGKQKRARRRHAPEFKSEVVALVRSGAKTVAEAARDLGLADSLIRTWMAQAETAGEGAEGGLTAAEKEELKHLRREVKTLRMEREILKKAATFFAKENA